MARLADYRDLDEQTKKARMAVFYHLHGDDPGETLVPFPNASSPLCRVYEYWLYFTFDEFMQCNSIALNRHYHDWEKFFVFVSAFDHKVRGMVGSAHLSVNASNVFTLPTPVDPGPSGYHPYVLVELGGHATCPDMNQNGVFDRSADVNGCAQAVAWGIEDLVGLRLPDDLVGGPDEEGDEGYDLPAIEGLEVIVDPLLTEDLHFWEGSREYACAHCPPFGGPFESITQKYSSTFQLSPVAEVGVGV
jgi:hypothetical protein